MVWATVAMAGASLLGSYLSSKNTAKAIGDINTDFQTPQIDTTKAEDYFSQSMNYLQDQYGAGLRAYTSSTIDAQARLQPYNETARAAMSEMRQFMGMSELDPLTGISQRLDALTEGFQAPEGRILDPSGQDIFYQGEGGRTFSKASNTDYINSAIRAAQEQLVTLEGEEDPARRAKAQTQALSTLQEAQARIDQVVAGAQGKPETTSLRALQADLGNVKSTLQTKFKPELQKMSSEEITNRLENLPEYQFQLKQGQQALERSAAAQGRLLSGKTLIEAQEYGQQLAQNVYQGHLSRLGQIAGMTMPAVSQQSAQGMAAGQGLLGAYGSLGQAQGQLRTSQGQGLLRAATQQAQMELQGRLGMAQIGAQQGQFAAQQQGQAMAGLGQVAGLAASMFGGGKGGKLF